MQSHTASCPDPLGDAQSVDCDRVSPPGQACPDCGCPIEPEDRFCSACGTPHEVAAGVHPPGADRQSRQVHFHCDGCGSDVGIDSDRRSYVCPFCQSTYVVEFSPEQTGRQQPEFVIGFAVTPEQARQKFAQWLRSNRWFRPRDLKDARIAQNLTGIYLPFWSFSMLAESTWSASIGEHWQRTETYTTTDSEGKVVTRTRTVQETEWWPLAGRHHRYHSGYLVSGSQGLPQRDADGIGPFHLPALKRYQPYFLAGWLCEEYSVAREAALEICQRQFDRDEQASVAAFMPGDVYRNLQVRTRFSHVNSDLCLLPVYVLSYHYRDRLYRFLVNGQTGKCAGDKPVSWGKIVLAIAAGLLMLLILFLLATVFLL